MNSNIDATNRSNPYQLSEVDVRNEPRYIKILNGLMEDICDISSGMTSPNNEINNNILATFNNSVTIHDDQFTINENNDQSIIDGYQESATVYPFVHDLSTNRLQNKFKFQQNIQSDDSQSTKIKIKCHPRSKFRPRTEKESKDSSHYLRCEGHMPSEYPTIYIPPIWKKQQNIIEVTLVGIDKQPHLYAIDNKERKVSSLIFKQNDSHSLYFHVTEKDYQNGEKPFQIEYIKSKQDAKITKDLIETRQLDQSMLRFTRYYQLADGTYQQDDASVEYSCVMTEDYGGFAIEDVFPSYGPMHTNKKVCIDIKGHLPKDFKNDLHIHIIANDINWIHQVENIKKNGNIFMFYMPVFPYTGINRAKVDIIILYKKDILYQCNYMYTRILDEELIAVNMNESNTTVNNEYLASDNNNRRTAVSSTRSSTGITNAKRFRK